MWCDQQQESPPRPALLSHRNVEEAAKAPGISAATLKRWMPVGCDGRLRLG